MKNMKKTLIFALCICTLSCSALSGCSDNSEKTADYEKRIAALESKITELENQVSQEDDEDDYDLGEVHEIYDDTAVIEAYKSGDSSQLDETDKYVYDGLKSAIDEIITEDLTEYEKEKAVYDYIFKNCHYDYDSLSAIDTEESYSHTPYGFFKNGSVICVGYATTFKLFMDALDIDCKIIHCVEDGEHAWNVVNIDGDWYHVDLTFDNGSDGTPDYSRFNVNDDIKEQDGYDWSDQDIPECTALKYCYLVANAVEIDSIYDIPAKIEEAFESGETSVYMKLAVPENADEDDACWELLDILSGINYDNEDEYLICPNPMANEGYIYFALSRVSNDDNYTDKLGSDDIFDFDSDKFAEAFEGMDGFSYDYYGINDYSEDYGEYLE